MKMKNTTAVCEICSKLIIIIMTPRQYVKIYSKSTLEKLEQFV